MGVIDAPVVVAGADTAAGAANARALDGEVRVMVLCGSDAAALGALAATLTSRTAIFAGDTATAAGAAALRELVEELFTARET